MSEKNAKSGWIFGPRADFWVFVGPILLAFVFLFFNHMGLFGFDDTLDANTSGGHYYAIQTYINMAHVYFVFWFTYGSAKQWAKHRHFFIGIPLLMFVINLVIGYFIDFWFITIMFAHFTMWHFIKQQQAWFYISAGKGSAERSPWTKRIDTLAITASTVGFTIASLSQEDFLGWFGMNDIVHFPLWLYWPMIWASLASIALYFIWHGYLSYKGYKTNWNAHILLIIAAFIWGYSRLVSHGPFSYYLNQLAHAVPYFYLGFRFMQVERAAGEPYHFPKAPVWIMVIVLIVVAGQLGHVEMQMRFTDTLTEILGRYRHILVASVFNAINITHYTLDKFFWDRTHNPDWVKALH